MLGYGKEFINDDLRGRVEARKTSDSTAKAEQSAMVDWKKSALQFKDLTLTKGQCVILEAVKDYYDSLKINQTLGDAFTLQQTRVAGYSAAFLPPTLETEELQIAWLDKVGRNPLKQKELFPNLVNPELPPVRVCIDFNSNPEQYKTDEYKIGNILNKTLIGPGSMVDPLVVFCYFFNAASSGDELIKVKFNRFNKKIKIESIKYKAKVKYTGKRSREYKSIEVVRKERTV